MSSINSPAQVKRVVDSLSFAMDGTQNSPLLRSAKRAMDDGRARCLDGAFVAAYLMEQLGFQPVILQMLASEAIFDHAVYIYPDKHNQLKTIGHSGFEALKSLPGCFDSSIDLVKEYARRAKANNIQIKGWALVSLKDMSAWRTSHGNVASTYMRWIRNIHFESL